MFISNRFWNKWRKECDVLKVAHHGSKYSTSEEFVSKTNADYAVISYGKNNNYGHPADIVKENLEKYGVKVYETAVSGTVTIETDGHDMKIETIY